MSEIKFACPHCAQHVACDTDYADLCIVCPGCGKPMLVPILSATDAADPELCPVAATPTPPKQLRPHGPALDFWTEEEWEEHARAKAGEPSGRTPLWIVSSLGTIILAAVLRAGDTGTSAIIATVVGGALLSGYLARKAGGGSVGNALAADANVFGRMLLTALMVMLAIPLIAFSVLFVGCGGCR